MSEMMTIFIAILLLRLDSGDSRLLMGTVKNHVNLLEGNQAAIDHLVQLRKDPLHSFLILDGLDDDGEFLCEPQDFFRMVSS